MNQTESGADAQSEKSGWQLRNLNVSQEMVYGQNYTLKDVYRLHLSFHGDRSFEALFFDQSHPKKIAETLRHLADAIDGMTMTSQATPSIPKSS